MHARKMTSKKAGTCRECGEQITPGQSIYWARTLGARHCDCTTAKYDSTRCTSCNGSGRRWNNAPCTACDGSGLREVQDYAKTVKNHVTMSPYINR